MFVETVHIRPSDPATDLQGLKTQLQEVSMAAVMVDNSVDWETLKGVATVVALSHVPVVAAFGRRSEQFHDLVDLIALAERESGPLTSWEDDGLDNFIFNIRFTYRGLLNITDQDRKTLVCYVSDCDAIPEDLALAIQRMRPHQW